ncbi:unnamed protein product [Bursaphelenchus xylophilus]|uniref:(pine wood nematode) hypothetical protein n=1 Tax=Bursaphelenchus xylophilus TaxID=6326 RepID=A0A1I7SUV6_BURXY|nr:unnamed protein product [Bursaphelenchus xylophilus]CAG9125848.1 unnamed protein product [Bursaphelenchus xylophilus]
MPSSEIITKKLDTSPHGSTASSGCRSDYALKCEVCAEDIRTFILGAKVCRACASFYKRAVLENLKYKCASGDYTCDTQGGRTQRIKCKACRYHKCQRANIEINVAGTAKDEGIGLTALSSTSEANLTPLLQELVKAYDEVAAAQLERVKEHHREINFTENTFVTPKKRFIYDIECHLLKPAIRFFEKTCKAYNKMPKDDKLTLINHVFVEFRNLHQAFLSKQYCPELDDPKVVFAPGYWADPFNIDYDWWFEGYVDKPAFNEYWNVVLPFTREFIDIIQKLKILQIDKVDTIVLIYMSLWKHAEYLNLYSKEMEEFKDSVTAEWMAHLDRRFGKETPVKLTSIMILYKRFDEIGIEYKNTSMQIKVLRNSGVNVVNCDISHLVDALRIADEV